MDAKTLGNAKTHNFENGTEVYNIGLQKKEIENLPDQNGYLNLAIVEKEGKLSVVNNPYKETGESLKNVKQFLNINKEQTLGLPDNAGWINITSAPKNEKTIEGQEHTLQTQLGKFAKNEHVVYMSGENGENTKYIGSGLSVENNSLGVVFKDKSKDGSFEKFNAVLDKNATLAVPESRQDTIYINIAKIPGQDNMFTAYPSADRNDQSAVHTLSLNPSKLNLVHADEKGDIRLTYSEKLNIGKDNANFNVLDTASLKKGAEKLYVGKGWDENHMAWKNEANKDAGNDFFPKAGDAVQFKVENDFYLNKNLGATEHVAHGTITGQTPEGKFEVESPAGKFSFGKDDLRPSDSKSVENFASSYNGLKEQYKNEQENKKSPKHAKVAEVLNTQDGGNDSKKEQSKGNAKTSTKSKDMSR
jgi:hypothetical protein